LLSARDQVVQDHEKMKASLEEKKVQSRQEVGKSGPEVAIDFRSFFLSFTSS